MVNCKRILFFWWLLQQGLPCQGQSLKTADGIVGSRLPQGFALGTHMGSDTGSVRLSDFAGKLVILDFWYTGCPNCIAHFPELGRLQQQFRDAIRILLVNPVEDAGQIRDRMLNQTRPNKLSEIFVANQLPVVLASASLKKLLPVRSFPSHAWIDSSGTIRVFGSPLNTHERKIRQLLAREPVSYVHTAFTGMPYDFSEALLLCGRNKPVQSASAIRGFDFRLNSTESFREDIPHPSSETRRSTYVNTDVLQLFHFAIGGRMLEGGWADLIHSPVSTNRYAWHLAYTVLETRDSASYSRKYIPSKKWTDEHFSSSGYCYEQIVPLQVSDTLRRDWMYTDLVRFFNAQRNIDISIQQRQITGYEIVADTGIFTDASEERPELTGQESREANETLAASLWDLHTANPDADLPYVFLRDRKSVRLPLHVPEWNAQSTFEDYKHALGMVGLSVVETSIKLPVLVITEDSRNQ